MALANHPLVPRADTFEFASERRRVEASTLVCLDLFSGPYQSVTLAARSFACSSACSVDWDSEFRPSVLADLVHWNPWTWMKSTLAFEKGQKVLLPGLLHCSPQCTALGAASSLHGDRLGQPFLSAEADNCLRVARSVCRTVRQLHGGPSLVSVENPAGNKLWKLPCFVALFDEGILVLVPVSYCMYGVNCQKNTWIACSPGLGTAWAFACDRSGSCGLMFRPPGGKPVHRGKAGGFSIVDARIPTGLTHGLVMAWRRHHGRIVLAPETANAYVVSLADATRLEREWARLAVEEG